MQQPSVLIIDDCEIERYMLVHQLNQIGVSDIVQKTDGTDGLAFLQDYEQNQHTYGTTFPPDLIILDVNMPLMGGFEFLQKFSELRTQLDLTKCQVLMYSASNDPQEKQLANQHDFVKGFIVKGELSFEALKSQVLVL